MTKRRVAKSSRRVDFDTLTPAEISVWTIRSAPADERFYLAGNPCSRGLLNPPEPPAERLHQPSLMWWGLITLSLCGAITMGVLTGMLLNGWIVAVITILGGLVGLLCSALCWVAGATPLRRRSHSHPVSDVRCETPAVRVIHPRSH